jgi:signal transduction histidine kinase
MIPRAMQASPPPLACPNCQAAIGPLDTTCHNCGADIQLMTLAAERALLQHALAETAAAAPLSPEQLVPRLGDYLVLKGYVSVAQLGAALAAQTQAATSHHRLIGQTLLDLGYLTADDLDRAIASRLLELQTALLQANHTLERRVTERTAELKDALERLSEFNQLKANFVANVSHELRTPLTHLKGYNTLLGDGTLGPLTDDQRQALLTTNGAIARLEQLINDLISYAAAAKGDLTLNARPCSAAQVVLQAVERSQAKADRQQVQLAHAIAPDLPPVLADEEKLFWTLMQLVDNGLKFTRPGGTVMVSAEVHAAHVVLSVQDTGIGIPPDRLQEIFEPFQQLDGSSTRRYGGTGLGLALVRRILEAHGAHMRVNSQAGLGSHFSFSLPRYEAG